MRIRLIFLALVVFSCSPDPDQVTDPLDLLAAAKTTFGTNIDFEALPNYANQGKPNYITKDNAGGNGIIDKQATLGRVLFYDKNLSKNKTIACASCHKQEHGFADPLVLSDGFAGGKTNRHSMGLVNARFYNNGRFFWDERASSLEAQVLMPMQDPVEMGMTLDSVLARVGHLPYYPELFENAFGDEAVTTDRISKALAQYVRSIMSYQSRYDEGRAQVQNPNQPFPNFTAQENQGKNLFFNPVLGGCAGCHGTEAFVAPGPRNNGLDATNTSDAGGGGITNNQAQEGLFKAPSLRNIALRPPYMHDGRFATLEAVVEHYSTGIKNNPNLSAPLRQPNGTIKLMNFTPQEKAAMVAFLNTLTDNALTADEKFSDPFKP